MPKSIDEFKKWKTIEAPLSTIEKVYKILEDGNAYSLIELGEKVGIITPKNKNFSESLKLLTPAVELVNLSLTLGNDDRIVHETMDDKEGTHIYYILKKFIE